MSKLSWLAGLSTHHQVAIANLVDLSKAFDILCLTWWPLWSLSPVGTDRYRSSLADWLSGRFVCRFGLSMAPFFVSKLCYPEKYALLEISLSLGFVWAAWQTQYHRKSCNTLEYMKIVCGQILLNWFKTLLSGLSTALETRHPPSLLCQRETIKGFDRILLEQ